MASIGGTTCTFIHTAAGRVPQTMREEIEVYRLAGVPGYGAMKLGLGAGEFHIVAVLLSNKVGVAQWEYLLQVKQGSIVTIIDDLGTSHTRCLLLHVGNARVTPARNAEGTITQRAELDVSGVKVG